MQGPPHLSQLRRGALEYCVLALLRDQEWYGFELAQKLRGDQMVTGEGTIYPLLARLRRDQRIDSVWRESTSGPPRRYYRLTQSGNQALRDFADDWQRFRDCVDNYLGRAESL